MARPTSPYGHHHQYKTIKVIGADEMWYDLNPRQLPVISSGDPFIKAILDMSQWFSTNEDGWFNGGNQ